MYKLSSYFHGLWQAIDDLRLAATYWIMKNLHTIAAVCFCLVLLIVAFVLLSESELI